MNKNRTKIKRYLSPKVFFSFTWEVQKKIIKFLDSELYIRLATSKKGCLIDFTLLALALVFWLNNLTILSIVFLFLLIPKLSVKNLNKMFTSVSTFLTNGIFMVLFSATVISICMIEFANFTSQLFVILFAFFIVWIFFSLIINNKVSTVVNSIFATIFGVLSILSDLILYLIPQNLYNAIIKLDDTDPIGHTHMEVIEYSFKLILAYPLILSSFTTLACILKGYWIEKYNDGLDI